MVGQIDKKEEIQRALKAYIIRDREKQRLEDEAEAEKTRKKKEQDEKKMKEESEFKVTKEKLVEVTKKHEQLQQDKIKVFEHLKKVVGESNKQVLAIDDLNRLYDIGLVVTNPSTPTHSTVHSAGSTSVTVLPRHSAVSSTNHFKTSVSSSIPVQTIPHQKRNRSPSPTIYRSSYYKQAAGPHAFQKLEDPHRNREYKSYLFKPNNNPQPGTYSAFYSPTQNAVYTMPSSSVHSNTPTYSTYGGSRENVEVLHKAQQQNISSIPPPPSPSLYSSHRSSIQNSTPSSVQSNHVYHSKSSQGYSDDKYYMVRPSAHVPVHGVIPIHQAPQSGKHGSITSGYPVRPVATQIGSQSQLHMQQHGSGHHGSQPSHHSSQPPVHSSSLSSHHSSQSHHVSSQQSQNIGHQPHHQSQSVHYQPSHHPQSHQVTQSSQQSTVSVSISQQQNHHLNPHHQQHVQQLHLQAHHPSSQSSSSHHQLIQHHGSSSIHHTSNQQHLQQMHQPHHPPHSQALHHSQISQPHIQQHISQQSQQSQPTSVVTSQAYANQMNAIQGGSRVMYSQANLPH